MYTYLISKLTNNGSQTYNHITSRTTSPYLGFTVVLLKLTSKQNRRNMVQKQQMAEGNSKSMAETVEKARGLLPIMAYTERLRPKGVPFSDFRYMKG